MPGWTGKTARFAAALASSATALDTEVAIGAGDGLSIEEIPLPEGEPSTNVFKVTDQAWPVTLSQGNVEPLDITLPLVPNYCSATGAFPGDEILMALLYAATTATQLGGSAAYLHTGTPASDHALANYISRFFTLAAAYNKASGVAYASVPSWMPTGMTLESKAGKDPLKISFKGIGTRTVYDSATNGATQWGNVTWIDRTSANIMRQLFHHNLANDGTNGGLWMAKSAAVGGSPVTFTRAACRQQVDSIKIDLDRKMKGFHTDGMYLTNILDDDMGECKVTLHWPQVRDEDWASTGVIGALKAWETAGTEAYFHFRPRWTWPTAIASSYYPYLEIGIPVLRPTKVDFSKAKAGKIMELQAEFEALAPTAAAHLPSCFQYLGGTSGTNFDFLYAAICNQTTAALIA